MMYTRYTNPVKFSLGLSDMGGLRPFSARDIKSLSGCKQILKEQ